MQPLVSYHYDCMTKQNRQTYLVPRVPAFNIVQLVDEHDEEYLSISVYHSEYDDFLELINVALKLRSDNLMCQW